MAGPHSVTLPFHGGVRRLDTVISLRISSVLVYTLGAASKVAVAAAQADSRHCMQSETWSLTDASMTPATEISS